MTKESRQGLLFDEKYAFEIRGPGIHMFSTFSAACPKQGNTQSGAIRNEREHDWSVSQLSSLPYLWQFGVLARLAQWILENGASHWPPY